MIEIDQALVSAFINAGLGLEIAHENIDFTPTADTAYAELRVLQNDISAATLKHSNETDGVFRVLLNWPANEGAIAPRQKADAIFAAFPVGKDLTYNGVTLTITGNQRQPGVNEDGWYRIVLTMPYKAFLTR